MRYRSLFGDFDLHWDLSPWYTVTTYGSWYNPETHDLVPKPEYKRSMAEEKQKKIERLEEQIKELKKEVKELGE
jgi:hypothetical protein